MNNETLLLFFVALTGVAVLLQAILLLALFLAVRKTAKSLQDEIESLRSTVVPAILTTRDFVLRVGPKIESITTDVADLAHDMRAQSVELQSALTEILERVRRQTSRVDAMVGNVLDGVDRAGGFVVEAVSLPMRQVSALVASAKAIIGVLRTKHPEPRQTHAPGDRDQFI